MTKSELFKAAHKAARLIKSIVGNYGIAFSISLKKIYAEIIAVSPISGKSNMQVMDDVCHRMLVRMRRSNCRNEQYLVDGIFNKVEGFMNKLQYGG